MSITMPVPVPAPVTAMKPRGECWQCGWHYTVTPAGALEPHFGVTVAGISTGRACSGTGRAPYVAQRAR